VAATAAPGVATLALTISAPVMVSPLRLTFAVSKAASAAVARETSVLRWVVSVASAPVARVTSLARFVVSVAAAAVARVAPAIHVLFGDGAQSQGRIATENERAGHGVAGFLHETAHPGRGRPFLPAGRCHRPAWRW